MNQTHDVHYMKALYIKEIRYYLTNPIGYIIIGLFAVVANFFFVKDIFVVGSASMRPFFELIPWLFLIFIPALTMRSIAEERRSNTIETLLSLPISEAQIVVAKFLALLSLVAIGLVLTFGLPIGLVMMAGMYIPEILVGYLGLLFAASLYIAISLFFSSMTENQVVAFLASVCTLFLFLVMATDIVASILPRTVIDSLLFFSPINQLRSFFKGLIDLRSIVYFTSFSVIFLMLTVINLEKRG